jgi:hypothetical protein
MCAGLRVFNCGVPRLRASVFIFGRRLFPTGERHGRENRLSKRFVPLSPISRHLFGNRLSPTNVAACWKVY